MAATNQMVKYNTDGQEMTLDSSTVRSYLVNGGGNVTDQEIMMFLKLCETKKLNPFIREAYLIKFGNAPATIVTGKDYFTKKANMNDRYEGFSAGVVVANGSGDLIEREGTIVVKAEELIGGWATVHRKDRKVPIKNTAMLTEYQRYKNDGTLMANWKSMPATMIRKVALVQSLREAFPEDFGGMYSPDEMPVDGANLPDKPIEVTWEEIPPVAPTTPTETMSSLKQQGKIHAEAKRLKWDERYLQSVLFKKYQTPHTAELTLKQASECIDGMTKLVPAIPVVDPAEQEFNQMADQSIDDLKQEMEQEAKDQVGERQPGDD
jgi:phage recombination protein Bet